MESLSIDERLKQMTFFADFDKYSEADEILILDRVEEESESVNRINDVEERTDDRESTMETSVNNDFLQAVIDEKNFYIKENGHLAAENTVLKSEILQLRCGLRTISKTDTRYDT